jgi:hypothetical protein
MLAISATCAQDYRISFNVRKIKCLIVSPHSRRALFDRFDDYLLSSTIKGKSSSSNLYIQATSWRPCSTTKNTLSNTRNNFVGQVNNIHSYFNNFDLFIRHKLLRHTILVSTTASYGCCRIAVLNNFVPGCKKAFG